MRFTTERIGLMAAGVSDVSDDESKDLAADLTDAVAVAKEADAALVQGIGALTIDAMIDEQGEAFGTTTIAMEQMRAARRKIAAFLRVPTDREYFDRLIAAMDAAGPCLWFGLPPCPKCGTDHGNPNCDANQDHYLREMVAESKPQPEKETQNEHAE